MWRFCSRSVLSFFLLFCFYSNFRRNDCFDQLHNFEGLHTIDTTSQWGHILSDQIICYKIQWLYIRTLITLENSCLRNSFVMYKSSGSLSAYRVNNVRQHGHRNDRALTAHLDEASYGSWVMDSRLDNSPTRSFIITTVIYFQRLILREDLRKGIMFCSVCSVNQAKEFSL